MSVPADFYVLDMNDECSPNPSLVILGRSFLSIARTNIGVNEVTLTTKFDREVAHFNIFDEMNTLLTLILCLLFMLLIPLCKNFLR